MQTGTLSVLIAALTLPLTLQPSPAEELTADEQDKRPPTGQVDRDGGSVRAVPRAFQDRDSGRFPKRGIGFRHGDHPARGIRGTGSTLFFFLGPSPYPDSFSMPPPLYEAPLDPGRWYYCDDPPGYYPQVAECRMPWHAVPPGDTLPPG